MKIKNLIKDLNYISFQGDENQDILGITIDSRKALKNYTYIAIKGFNLDGHNFINSAIQNGAKLIICEDDFFTQNQEISILKVKNSRLALSKITKNFYNNPTEKLNLIGVTGTNGKTSSTYFMEQILNEWGKSTAVIGTIEIRANGEKLDFDFATSTTPDTIELNELFNKFIQKNIQNVAMEVSSHALELEKVADCKFKIGIFTNLTQDHLDLHQNMQNYCIAKSKLFKMCEIGIINLDDEYASEILKNAKCKVFTYSIKKTSDLQAKNIKYLMDKVEFDININGNDEHFILNIPGKFSVYNALGVIGASLMLNIPIEIIKKGIFNIKGVKGRIQTIPNDKEFNVIIDYAHTPDGLENIISTVKGFTKGKVINVFGCGGDRDRKKRPLMAEISGKLADYSIITSDNPRSEIPEKIIEEIETGIINITKNYEKITDRKKAIFKAIKIAKKGDSVIIAGKGHENYEIFADKTIHFDDAEVAKEALEELN